MARETLKSFLAKNGKSADSISYTLKESPDGLGVDPNTGKELIDFVNETEGLLGDYLEHIIGESSNEFKIKPGNQKAGSSKRGDDLSLADSQGATKVFVEQGTQLKSALNSYSNSGKFNDAGESLDFLIDKVGKNFSNHEKLKEIKGGNLDKSGRITPKSQGEDNKIVQATQKVFKQNNRFANIGDEKQKAFMSEDRDVASFESEGTTEGSLKVSRTFGEYNKDRDVISLDSLKKLGASLLLKSSGFSKGSTPGSSSDPDTIKIADLTSDNVSKTGGYSKIEVSNLRAKNAKGFPEDLLGNSIRQGRGDFNNLDPDAENAKSYGNTYNTEFQFSNKNLRLHQIEAAISLITLSKIGKTFFKTFINLLRESDKISLVKSTESFVSDNKSADIGTYMMGESSRLSSTKLSFALTNSILTNTVHNYSDCVDRGLQVILGSATNQTKESVTASRTSVSESPGFWLAVSRSVLKTFDQTIKKYGNGTLEGIDSASLPLVYRDILETNKFIQFYNVMAIVGDASLTASNGLKNDIPKVGDKVESVHHRNVDKIPDTRAIPGKSRKNLGSKKGYKNNKLSWAQGETQSAYLLPANIIRAGLKLNNMVYGANPVRGLLGSGLVKNTYTGLDTEGSYNRIPGQVVKVIEDRLDAEYVPFYIQDLRTNEIISFQAFLTDLTDSISSKFNSTSGYGRLDQVQTYDSTTRTISVGFNLMATSKEDFDEMWYKINKLTTLLYPQWTPGTLVSNGNSESSASTFYQPFSQVMGASPIIRLRVGDVIKSNYSRFNLARTFGIGDENVDPSPVKNFGEKSSIKGNFRSDIQNRSLINANGSKNKKSLKDIQDVILKGWLTVFGSPQSTMVSVFKSKLGSPISNIGKVSKNLGMNAAIQLLSNALVNGYANPLAVDAIIRQLRDPNLDGENIGIGSSAVGDFSRKIDNSQTKLVNNGAVSISGYNDNKVSSFFRIMYLKANNNEGYYSAGSSEESAGKRYFFARRTRVKIVEKVVGVKPLKPGVIGYKVKVVDANSPFAINSGTELIVQHADILPDPKALFTNSLVGASLFLADPTGLIDNVANLVQESSMNLGIPNEVVDLVRFIYASDTSRFMQPALNPFVRAYETTKGRGLAGVIDGGISFKWLDESFNWETDFNSRAPMGCTISFKMNVIHDIPPGLDHTGFNRAPIYNVGEIMKNVAGDVYSDGGAQAEFNFRKEGGLAARVKGGKN